MRAANRSGRFFPKGGEIDPKDRVAKRTNRRIVWQSFELLTPSKIYTLFPNSQPNLRIVCDYSPATQMSTVFEILNQVLKIKRNTRYRRSLCFRPGSIFQKLWYQLETVSEHCFEDGYIPYTDESSVHYRETLQVGRPAGSSSWIGCDYPRVYCECARRKIIQQSDQIDKTDLWSSNATRMARVQLMVQGESQGWDAYAPDYIWGSESYV